MRRVVGLSGGVVRFRVPWLAVMMRWLRLRPMPVPWSFVVKKGVKMRVAVSGVRGVPSFSMSRVILRFAGWLMRMAMTVALASIAFLIRLMRTCST